MKKLLADQKDVLLHALGQHHTPKLRDMGWRSYFCVGKGEVDYDTCESLVELGYMTQKGNIFYVTDEGAAAVGVRIKRK